MIFKILIFFILMIFPFGQLARLPVEVPQVNIYLQDLLVGSLVASWVFYHFLSKKPFLKPPLTLPILTFFLAAAFSLVVNLPRLAPQETLVASLYLLRWIFYAGMYFVIYENISIYQYINILKWGLVLVGVEAAFLGIIQYFLYPDLSYLFYLGWDPHKFRVFGTFFDPGFLGMILVLTLILIISLLWSNHQHVNMLTCWVAKFGGILTYTALALTYSRSSYLAYLVGMGAIAWIKKAPKFFLAATLVGILTILLLPRPPGSEGVRLEREESFKARIKNWQNSIKIARDHPIFGVGFNAYRYAQRTYGFLDEEDWRESHAGAGADSSLLFILATTGILGLFAYTLFLYNILIYHIKNPAVFASTCALLIHSFFNNSLFYPWIMLWMWILIGINSCHSNHIDKSSSEESRRDS